MSRNAISRLAVVVLLALAVAGLLAVKNRRPPAQPAEQAAAAPSLAALPRLLDLGSTKCQACLEMEKVLADLRRDYAGRLQVDFIDVFEQGKAAEEYGITLIPTQIFYDGAGKELYRHQGFISAADVAAKFRELGVGL